MFFRKRLRNDKFNIFVRVRQKENSGEKEEGTKKSFKFWYFFSILSEFWVKLEISDTFYLNQNSDFYLSEKKNSGANEEKQEKKFKFWQLFNSEFWF